jgi:hypothetical protein
MPCWQLDASHFMVVVDCASAEGADLASQLLQGHCGDVTRQSGSHDRSQPKHIGTTQEPPLLSALTGGTLVLDNIHKVGWTHPGFFHVVLPLHR